MKKLMFTKSISTHGNLLSTYVFRNDDEVAEWKTNVLPRLEREHGTLLLIESLLNYLPEIGKECCVLGDGDEIYMVEDVIQYSPYRYGFVLNTGWTEEVWKCFDITKRKIV